MTGRSAPSRRLATLAIAAVIGLGMLAVADNGTVDVIVAASAAMPTAGMNASTSASTQSREINLFIFLHPFLFLHVKLTIAT